MRRSAKLPALRGDRAARDPDRAEFLLHAVGQAQGDRHQRAQRACAEDARSVQGLARARLRLLLRQEAGAADDQDQERRKGLSHRTALDDQPLAVALRPHNNYHHHLPWTVQWLVPTSHSGHKPTKHCTTTALYELSWDMRVSRLFRPDLYAPGAGPKRTRQPAAGACRPPGVRG